MKQLITILYITFLLGITNLQGQNYIPMAVDSAVWLIGHSPDIAGNYTTYTMEFTNGDTIVNNVHYYKVYSQGSHSSQNPRHLLRLKMLIRDNITTHTVHGIIIPDDVSSCPTLVDIPLFDFNPYINTNQGSTNVINCHGVNAVFHIDTVNVYGMDRRRFTMEFGGWLEGVGSYNQGLNPLNGGSSELVDYCRGTPSDCGAYAWVKTKDIRTYQNGKLYPNPAQHQARLELEEYINHGRVLIYNLLGQLQSEQYFEGQEAVLEVGDYEKGIYMVQVFDGNKLVYGEKLVVAE
jgi:hypothetical protein